MKSDTNKSFLMSADYTCTAVPFNDGMAFHVQAFRRFDPHKNKFIGVAWLDQHDQLDGDKVRDAFQVAWINALLQVRVHVERVIAAFHDYQTKKTLKVQEENRILYYESVPRISLNESSFRHSYSKSMTFPGEIRTTAEIIKRYGKSALEAINSPMIDPAKLKALPPIVRRSEFTSGGHIDTRTTYTYALPPLFYLRFGRDYCGTVNAKSRVDARGEIKALLRRCGHVLDRLPKEIVIQEMNHNYERMQSVRI